MPQDDNNENKYFALKESKEFARICLDKSRTFFDIMNKNAYIEKIRRNWQFYHGIFNDSSHQVSFTGEDGELVRLPINEYRNIAEHIINMITANRPTMDARAVNSDYKSQAQTYLANGILDYYMREKGLETVLRRSVEMAVVLGAAFIKMEWNTTAGEAYDADPETGAMQYEGEIEFSNLSPLDVVVDGMKDKWDDEWVITRSFQNRYNLIAKYPKYKEKIEQLPVVDSRQYYFSLSLWSNDNTDLIPVYEAYHKKTDAVPEGRYAMFLSEEIVLLDIGLPYRVVPIFRIAPGDIMGTPYGYTPMFDIYPIQEALNALHGSIMSNQNAFAVQNIWVKKGADLNYTSIPGGLNIVESNEKPESLNLTETPTEVFKYLEMLKTSIETISGVNSVARGAPQPSLQSGTSLALVQAMALQFVTRLQHSYVRIIENLGTALIQILKDFATTPKIVALVGKNNRTYLKEFTGESLTAINRVIVDVGNPLSRTLAGRVQMADNLLQYQMIKDPRQYFQVLTTGRLDYLYQGEMDQLLLIQRENESLMEGQPVNAIWTDEHKLHIKEHSCVLSDPELRNDFMLVQNVTAHIQQHVMLLKTTDPEQLMLLGQQPLAMAPPMPMPPPGSPEEAGIMAAPGGLVQPGEEIIGPNQVPNTLPGLPEVSPEMLANPAIQELIMGNVGDKSQRG